MIKNILSIVADALGITRWFQRRAERQENREQGRRDAALESERKTSNEAMEREKRRDELDRLDRDQLRDRMYPKD